MRRTRSPYAGGKGRILSIFGAVLAHCAAIMPVLRRVKVKFCRDADRAHEEKWRLFAHANHHPWTVCFARAADLELSPCEVVGMSAHEIGHIVGDYLGLEAHRTMLGNGRRTPKAVQDEADEVARKIFGIEIRYNSRTLQTAPAETVARILSRYL